MSIINRTLGKNQQRNVLVIYINKEYIYKIAIYIDHVCVCACSIT